MTEQFPACILIVEDSMGVAQALQRALGLYGDGLYQVKTCDSGEAALKQLHEGTFDLLISDLRLPGMNGLDLLERVRHIRPATRALLITAYGSPDIEARARGLANAYLAKPFSLQELIRLVGRVLAESPPSQAVTATRLASPSTQPMSHEALHFDKRKNAHLILLACDLDGTLTGDNGIEPETWQALRDARYAGLGLILVTGRTLDRLEAEYAFDDLCEAIVAENGAVIYYPRRGTIALPFGTLDPGILRHMEKLEVPLERGMAMAATWVPRDEEVLRALRETRSGAVIEFNRGAMMVLPPGASKGNGLRAALQELGYSAHNVVAVGDAENDRSLLEAAELGVAVANAQPALKNSADIVLSQPGGSGVQALIQMLLDGKIPPRPARPTQRLVLGTRLSGPPVELDAFALLENNLGIFGSSGSGKSWLAGLLAEELLKQKYQICIIDPEGDYRALGASPHTLLLGGPDTTLPRVADVLNISEWNNISLVLDLSASEQAARNEYVGEFLRALRGLRGRRGRPHCFLVDEIQSFCPVEGGSLTELFLEAMRWGGFSVISYRVSQVAAPLLAALDHLLVTRLNLKEELDALVPYLGRFPTGAAVLADLPLLPKGQAYLCLNPNQPWLLGKKDVIKLRVGRRVVPHIRHLHKYLRVPMPEAKRFYFHDLNGRPAGRSAASLWEFREAIRDIPVSSLQYHMKRGDFEQWLHNVLHDEELARRIHKAADHHLEGEALRRALLEIVIERYEELELLA